MIWSKLNSQLSKSSCAWNFVNFQNSSNLKCWGNAKVEKRVSPDKSKNPRPQETAKRAQESGVARKLWGCRDVSLQPSTSALTVNLGLFSVCEPFSYSVNGTNSKHLFHQFRPELPSLTNVILCSWTLWLTSTASHCWHAEQSFQFKIVQKEFNTTTHIAFIHYTGFWYMCKYF